MAIKQVGIRAATFFREVREELARVSWPTRDELLGSLMIVFIGVAILASYIGAVDFVLSKTVRIFLK